jgi:hypothetical protein
MREDRERVNVIALDKNRYQEPISSAGFNGEETT